MLYVLLMLEVTVTVAVICEYSEFSGLITIVGEIPMALSFTENESFIYSANACPPFVPRCFAESEYDAGVIDLESLGHLNDYSIREHTGADEPDLKYRDVSGVIGVGANSRFLENTMIILRDFSDTVVVDFVEESKFKFEQDVNHWVSTDYIPGTNIWSFQMRDVRVVFDPSSRDLVIPSFHKRLLLQELGKRVLIGERGRVSIHCDSPSTTIDLAFADGTTLSVPVGIQAGDGGLWCPLSIRIKYGQDDVVTMGRHLIQSVDQLLFDTRRRRIEFYGLKSPLQTSARSVWTTDFPNSFLPAFSIPRMDASTIALISQKVAPANKYGFLLASFDSFVLGTKGSRRECWVMVHRGYEHGGQKPPRGKQFLESTASDIQVVVEDGVLMFNLIPGDLAIILYIYSDRIDICLATDPLDNPISQSGRNMPANQTPPPNVGCFGWFCSWRKGSRVAAGV